MIKVADFPTSVWTGLNARRESRMEDRGPDALDWDEIVAEVIAVENELTAGLDGDNVKNLANGSLVGGIPIVIQINIADGAGDTDVVMTNKIRVIDVLAVKIAANGGASDSVTIKNGSTAITNAMSLNINDQVVARATSINDASHEIAAGGTLRVTAANTTNNACIVYVHAIRVA